MGSYFPDQGLNLRPLHWKVDSFYFFSLNLLFYVGVYLIDHVVVISVNSEGSQPCIHMYAFSPKPRSYPGWHITLSRVPCEMQ